MIHEIPKEHKDKKGYSYCRICGEEFLNEFWTKRHIKNPKDSKFSKVCNEEWEFVKEKYNATVRSLIKNVKAGDTKNY